MHAYIHAYIHIYMHTSIYTCMHTYRHYVICWEVAPAVPAQLHLPQKNHHISVRACACWLSFAWGLVGGVRVRAARRTCKFLCMHAYFLMSEAARKATPNTRGMYENVLRRMATVPKTPPVQNRCFPQPNPTSPHLILTLMLTSPHPTLILTSPRPS